MIVQGIRERPDGEIVNFKASVFDAESVYHAVKKWHEQVEDSQAFIVKEVGGHSIP